MRVVVASAFVSVVLVSIGAAGCGGGETPAAESWANDVCTSIGDWKDKIRQDGDDVRAELRSPSSGTLTRIGESVQSAVDATTQLAADLKALDAPDVGSGDQAKQQVDAFATQLQTTVEQTKTTVDNIPDNASIVEIGTALAPLVPSLDTLAQKGKSALAAVEATGSEIKDGFQNADACKPLR